MDTARAEKMDGSLIRISLPARTRAEDENPALVFVSSLSAGSRRTMADALTIIARMIAPEADGAHFPWGGLRYQHTQAIRTRLAEGYAFTTANKMLSALRGVLREAWRLQQIPAEDYQRAVDLKPVRGSTLPAGRGLDAGEVKALFVACKDGTPSGARDAALLALLYGGGLRRSEAAALDASDYDTATGALTIRHGKGNKARTVYLKNGSRAAVEDWLTIRGTDSGPLLYAVRKSGALEPQRITGQAILYILRKTALRGGVAAFSPHDLRRSFISDMLDAGADIATVQKIAGHASPDTTSRYDRRGELAKERAAELLHVPYIR